MKRFMQVILGINIAILVVVDEIGPLFQIGPNARIAAAEPIMFRQYAAVALAYAIVLLFFVWPRFVREPVWLLFPAIVLIALWFDAVYELAASSDPVSENLPPAVIRAILVACYLFGYFRLRSRARDLGQITTNAAGRAGARATT
jgi:hypothetical protein